MLGIVNYGGFVVASVLLNLTPGADTIYIMTKSAAGGKREGVASAFGILTGILLHTVLAALGLSAVLATSAVAFTAVKLLGAIYLIAMGVRTILSKRTVLEEGVGQAGHNLATVFRQGIITNAFNPKVALFFLAFLPQYVDAGVQHGPLPFLLLGLTFVCTSTVWCMLVVQFSSLLTRLVRRSDRVGRWTNRITGCIYIGLGVHVMRAKMSS